MRRRVSAIVSISYQQLVTIIRILDTVGPWSWWCIYFDFDLSWSALTLYNNDYICLWACVVRDQRSFGWDCRPFSSWNVSIKYNKTRFLNVHNCVCFNPHTTFKCDYLGPLDYYCRYISMWTNGSIGWSCVLIVYLIRIENITCLFESLITE